VRRFSHQMKSVGLSESLLELKTSPFSNKGTKNIQPSASRVRLFCQRKKSQQDHHGRWDFQRKTISE
jgi:hypothetical protein